MRPLNTGIVWVAESEGMMAKGKPVSPEKEDLIVKMAEAGYSSGRIGEAYGIAAGSVSTILRRRNIKPSCGRKPFNGR